MAKRKKARKTRKAKTTRKARPAKRKAKRRSTKRKSGLTQKTYSLSPALQAVVGAKSATRPQVVKKLWAYIKSHKCQDSKNKRLIVPDRKLEAVLGKRPVDMLKMAGLLSKHIK